jgi:hypothetical protein
MVKHHLIPRCTLLPLVGLFLFGAETLPVNATSTTVSVIFLDQFGQVYSHQSINAGSSYLIPNMSLPSLGFLSLSFQGWDSNGDGLADPLPSIANQNLTFQAVVLAEDSGVSLKASQQDLTPSFLAETSSVYTPKVTFNEGSALYARIRSGADHEEIFEIGSAVERFDLYGYDGGGYPNATLSGIKIQCQPRTTPLAIGFYNLDLSASKGAALLTCDSPVQLTMTLGGTTRTIIKNGQRYNHPYELRGGKGQDGEEGHPAIKAQDLVIQGNGFTYDLFGGEGGTGRTSSKGGDGAPGVLVNGSLNIRYSSLYIQGGDGGVGGEGAPGKNGCYLTTRNNDLSGYDGEDGGRRQSGRTRRRWRPGD